MSIEFFVRYHLQHGYTAQEVERCLAAFDRAQADRAARLLAERSYTPLHGQRVVFVGDSITQDNLGYRATVSRAASLSAFDASISGATAITIEEKATRTIEEAKPALVSLMIGTNDSISLGTMGNYQVDPTEYSKRVSNIIACATAQGTRVLLFEIPPIDEEPFAAYYTERDRFQTNETIAMYNRVLQEIATRHHVSLLPNDWLLGQHAYFEPDGVHLSVEGQTEFAKRWLDAAMKII